MNLPLSQNPAAIGGTSCFNASNSYNKIVADEKARILAWLSPLEPQARHQDIRTRRLEAVGEWALQTPEFLNWRNCEDASVDPTLFFYGDPGVGKTYMSSLVIDTLSDQIVGENAAIFSLFFDFPAQDEQTPTNMLGGLLKQIVARSAELPEEVAQTFRQSKESNGGGSLRLPDILILLQKLLNSFDRVFICVDALDECLTKYRPEFLRSLRCLIQGSPGIRLFFTGRPHIRAEITKYISKDTAIVPFAPTAEDIKAYLSVYLSQKLEEDPYPEAMNNSLKEDILRTIPEKISEIFILVDLNVDSILAEMTLHRRKEKLSEVTNGQLLGDAYGATLQRINKLGGNKPQVGMAVLMWISNSQRPLQINELCDALAVGIGSPDLNTANAPPMQTVLGCCLGLVTADSEASTVRLIHSTLKEYLSAQPRLFEQAHSTIAETCLTYLNFDSVKNLSPALNTAPPTSPLLQYASSYWATHACQGITERVKSLALELLDQYDSHISAKLLLLNDSQWPWELTRKNCPRGFTGLHCLAYLGVTELLSPLIGMKSWDVNGRDFTGSTPLIWAARRGHTDTVKQLLELENIEADLPDDRGRTPLLWASRKRHGEVVKLLLDRNEINPNSVENDGESPLWWAAYMGYEEIVELLIDREGINPNLSGRYGQTPLCQAVYRGHDGVAKMLLGRQDINPNLADNDGETPLWWAVFKGRHELVETLLRRHDVNPNSEGSDGETPLWRAAIDERQEIAKLLLAREDTDPNKARDDGQTPLCKASEMGHEGITKLLLARRDIDINAGGNDGGTPLWRAATGEHDTIVKILLERGDINPNPTDKAKQTPLLWAAGKGYVEIVKALLGHRGVDPNITDSRGRTPLSCATEGGHTTVVNILLGLEDLEPYPTCDPNQPTKE